MSLGRLEAYEKTLTDEGILLIPKSESRLQKLIDRILRVLTFGGQNRYMSDYVTTLGRRIYLPANWSTLEPDVRYCILRHEMVHVAQFRRYTWPGMALLYIFLPLPFGWAAGRAWLEWEGYQETLRATWEVFGEDAAKSLSLRQDIIRRFTGPDYGWMWVHGKTIERAIDRHLDRLENFFSKKDAKN